MAFVVRFWGVRGSIACPSPRHMTYGGNTACVEVAVGDGRIILDAGTGIRDLGVLLLKEDTRRAQLLLSHTHWDHISGFPFFSPAFVGGRAFRVMAGHLNAHGGVRATLAGQMMQPMFPVPLEIMKSDLIFEDFEAGDRFTLENGVHVRTAKLNHPSGATAYRLEHGGKSLCYVTDTEHKVGMPDQNILGLIEGADLVIYDSTYTDDEFPSKLGWGHSTWQEGVRLCRAAHVKKLVIFHHEPDHEDERMAQIEREARAVWDGAIVARESMQIDLC
jgi:phosphoribosyl 1,2-cyclic phosphodiesterase